ncbi:MAG: hypothetical protein ACP6IS_06815 [Candidatus Asgardarchaeia archaeon]
MSDWAFTYFVINIFFLVGYMAFSTAVIFALYFFYRVYSSYYKRPIINIMLTSSFSLLSFGLVLNFLYIFLFYEFYDLEFISIFSMVLGLFLANIFSIFFVKKNSSNLLLLIGASFSIIIITAILVHFSYVEKKISQYVYLYNSFVLVILALIVLFLLKVGKFVTTINPYSKVLKFYYYFGITLVLLCVFLSGLLMYIFGFTFNPYSNLLLNYLVLEMFSFFGSVLFTFPIIVTYLYYREGELIR